MNRKKQVWFLCFIVILLSLSTSVKVADAMMQDYKPTFKINQNIKHTRILKHTKKYQAFLCLALNAYYEAPAHKERGLLEPIENQYGVALVALNRAQHSYKKV